MANLERHAYEADDGPAFDEDENDGGTQEASRLPLLIVIALVVLASFAGVVWLAYTQGVERGREDAPQIAAAARAPSEVPNVQSPPYTGLKIYQQPASVTEDSIKTKKAVPPSPAHSAASVGSSAPPALRPASATTEKSAAIRATLLAATRAASASRLSVAPPSPAPPAMSPVASTASASDRSGAEAALPMRGGIFLQIGSYKSNAEARQSWSAFRTRHEIAAGYRPDVKSADLGAKGTWYRLRLGPFADKQSAASFCEKLRRGGANCLVAK